jgi:hypothetical protein
MWIESCMILCDVSQQHVILQKQRKSLVFSHSVMHV